jgi:O-antigen ligase
MSGVVLTNRIVEAEPALALDRPRVGLLYAAATPLLASIANVQNLSFGGLNYTGPLWLAALAVGMAVLAAELALRHPAVPFPLKAWLPWLLLLFASLAWSHPLGRDHIQAALQTSMPLLVAMISSVFVRTPAAYAVLVRGFGAALAVMAAFVAVELTGLFSAAGIPLESRSLSLTLVVVSAVYLSLLPERPRAAACVWLISLCITVVTGSRMAMVALLALPILYPLHRRAWHRWGIVALLLLMAAGLFFTPTIQSRFFGEDQASAEGLMDPEAIGTGRFEAWPLILEEAWRRPWLGSGVGASAIFVPTVWPRMAHPHNDYLRVFLELGVVGLAIFLLTLAWQLFDIRRRIVRIPRDPQTRRYVYDPAQSAWVAAWLGLCAFLLTACTDNPLIYNIWFMNPLFAVIGAAYGLASPPQPRATVHVPRSSG